VLAAWADAGLQPRGKGLQKSKHLLDNPAARCVEARSPCSREAVSYSAIGSKPAKLLTGLQFCSSLISGLDKCGGRGRQPAWSTIRKVSIYLILGEPHEIVNRHSRESNLRQQTLQERTRSIWFGMKLQAAIFYLYAPQ
jgi:hypothetical protein